MRKVHSLRKMRSRRANGGRPNATCRRPLAIENLEDRVVLSGVSELASDAATVDPPPDEAAAVETAGVSDVQANPQPAVPQIEDGTLRVDADENVVVRQFIDYRMQAVVEVEVARQWYSFPAEQVAQVQVNTPLGEQGVAVDPTVDKPVQVIDPRAADQLFEQENSPLVASPVEDTLEPIGPVPLTMPPATDPPATGTLQAEGEDPAPVPVAPEITEFNGDQERTYWRFWGTVTDDDPVDGLIVRYSGVNGILDGKTAVVDEFGIFEIIVEIPAGTQGVAHAQTTDRDGLDSNIAEVLVLA